jgi:hypothetical protein
MTAIARRPSMSARYPVTSAPQEHAAASRCGGGPRPSQKDTGRTGRLYQKEQRARGALLAKRVFVENRSSEIQSPTGRRCQRPALQYPVQHRRTRERRLHHGYRGAGAQFACRKCGHRGQRGCTGNAGPRGRRRFSCERPGETRQVNHADAPQDMLRRSGTDLAPRAFTGALRLTTASLRQIVEMNCDVSLTLTPLPKRRSALQRPKV